jgi:ZIP family zinc transporter
LALTDLGLGALTVLLATSAGAFAVLFLKGVGRRGNSAMLAFAAGVMAYSAVEMLNQSHHSAGDIVMLIGFLIGIIAIFLGERALPHIHRHIKKKDIADEKKKALLIAGTITIHNLPEGFAIATAFAASTPLGWFVTTSIALQDIPEGALVSAPLSYYGMGKERSIFYGIFSGVAEAAAAVLGYLFLSSFSGLVPGALAFSAGAMIYVVFVELMPDAMDKGMERLAALCFISGAAVAFAIATLLAV